MCRGWENDMGCTEQTPLTTEILLLKVMTSIKQLLACAKYISNYQIKFANATEWLFYLVLVT